MKNVDSLLKAELEKLGVPVERLKYGGKAACFIVYQLVVGRDTFFSDDEEGAQEFTYQVHVYSKTDYIDILQRLKTALKAAGFYAITIDAETYPVETTFAYYRLIELSATGTLDDPIPYPETAGIVVNVVSGLYYSYKGAVYLAKADMPNCVYPPDTAGLWQWEKVT